MIPLHRLAPFDADLDLASPNHGPRPPGSAIRLIVLHATADNGSERGAESWMRNPDSQVSAHLHFRRDGTIVRLVDDRRRAWHAGRSSWPGIPDVNSESLGWEIANRNDGQEPYTEAQYGAVAAVLRHYMPQGLEWGSVVAHAHVAPDRKTDPRGWDWRRMWELVDAADPLPIPLVQMAESMKRQPQPNLERVHPLRKPVSEIALPGESAVDFLVRVGQGAGQVLGPIPRMIWDHLLATVLDRIEDAADDVTERVFGDGE